MEARTVLVTGSGRGYGEVLARRFAKAGARVVVLGRDSGRIAALAAELGGIPVAADVLDASAVRTALADARLPALDVVVNNAGDGGPLGTAWTVDPDAWWRALEVNVRGTHTVTSAVLPSMIEAGKGLVVNIVSYAGTARWPLGSAYAVSKAALIKYGENLAVELRRHSIDVLNYHPGILEIGLTETLFASEPEPGTPSHGVAKWFRGEIAAGRSVDADTSARRLVEYVDAVGAHPGLLSGRYVTAYDDVTDIVQRVQQGPPELFTLGLLDDRFDQSR